jgi:hypothetical protein
MQIGIRNYLMENSSVLIISRQWLTIYETFLLYLLDKQQWLSFGCELSLETTFVIMEVLVGVDWHSMHILTTPPREI